MVSTQNQHAINIVWQQSRVSSRRMWTVSFHAQYFIRMNFRKFPWDTQQLLIQLKYTHDTQVRAK